MFKRFISFVFMLALMLPLSSVKANGSLDSEAFLNLLLTQLAYQDPTEPMSNAEMVSQLADLTMMEQSAELTRAMEGLRRQMYDSQGLYASGLVGKGVMVLADLFIVEEGRHPDGEVLLNYASKELRIEVYPDGEDPDDTDSIAILDMGEQSDGQIPFDLHNLKDPLEDGSYRMYAYAKVDEQDIDMTIVQRSVVKSVVFPGNGQDVLIDVAWIGLVPIYAITEFQGDYVAGDGDDGEEEEPPGKEPLPMPPPEKDPLPIPPPEKETAPAGQFSAFGNDLIRLLSTADGAASLADMKRNRRNGETWTSNPLFELRKSQQNSKRQPVTRRQALFRTL